VIDRYLHIMLIRPGGQGERGHGRDAQVRSRLDPRGFRLLALLGVVAVVVALPLAVASAGPIGEKEVAIRTPVHGYGKRYGFSRSELPGIGIARAVRCGPQLFSADGIEAQTCVMMRGWKTWARTYYRNATGEKLSSVLSFMGPDGRSIEMRCAVASADEPEICETPRRRLTGEPGAYSAVAEFAGDDGRGPLLLRSGSDAGGGSGR
jgi:hypothetical protein